MKGQSHGTCRQRQGSASFNAFSPRIPSLKGQFSKRRHFRHSTVATSQPDPIQCCSNPIASLSELFFNVVRGLGDVGDGRDPAGPHLSV